MIELTEENYEAEINSCRSVIVYFYTNWCRFCTKMIPVFDGLAKKLSLRAKFAKVDIDKQKKLAEHNNLKGVPCIILYKNGKEIGRILGIEEKDVLEEKILSHISDIY